MNCWKTLGIKSTSDKEIIKSAYRALVKKYHPDLAKTPEKVRINTIKCAELNLAYQKALLEADQIKISDESIPISDSMRLYKKENVFIRIFRVIAIMIIVLLIGGLIQIGIPNLVEYFKTNEMAKVVLGVPVKMFGFAIISTAISLSNAIIAFLILDFLVVKFIPKVYFSKLFWIIVVILNTTIAINNLIPFKVFDNETNNTNIFILVWNIWPIIFLISWIRTFIKYNSIKDKSFLENLS
ncbi:MAG: J domain-containing protein [Saprospiraceae bacterium]|mgnify:CR=1 FL=1|nr:J domain-containing protein [Saprospiraceae bacterium]